MSCFLASVNGAPSRPRAFKLQAITALQHGALDALHFIGQKVANPIDSKASDMLCLNNLITVHARNMLDGSESGVPGEKSHLPPLITRDEGQERRDCLCQIHWISR